MGDTKFNRWSDDEKKQLADIIEIGKSKNKSIQESCMIAALKLRRTVEGCTWQYYTFIAKANKGEVVIPKGKPGRPKGAKNKPKDEPVKEVVQALGINSYETLEESKSLIDVVDEPVKEPVVMDSNWDFQNAQPKEEPTPVIEVKEPVISLYVSHGEPETAEIISMTPDVIVARCRGIFIIIKK